MNRVKRFFKYTKTKGNQNALETEFIHIAKGLNEKDEDTLLCESAISLCCALLPIAFVSPNFRKINQKHLRRLTQRSKRA